MTKEELSHKWLKNSDKKLENDEKWCKFVTNRASSNKRQMDIKLIREDLNKTMNPFTQELVIAVNVRLDPDAKIKDGYGGEVPASNLIERDKSAKVYQSAANRDRAMNLSATAMRMFVFIMYELDGTDDWIMLDPDWYKDASGAGSRNMYKKAKDELVRYGYISRTEHRNVYWVNPALVFAGNRVSKFKDNVVIKDTFTGKHQTNVAPKINTGKTRLNRKKWTMDEEIKYGEQGFKQTV